MPDLLADIYQESCLSVEFPSSQEQDVEVWDLQVPLDSVVGEWPASEDSGSRSMEISLDEARNVLLVLPKKSAASWSLCVYWPSPSTCFDLVTPRSWEGS